MDAEASDGAALAVAVEDAAAAADGNAYDGGDGPGGVGPGPDGAEDAANGSALRKRAVSGALWNYGSFTYLKLLSLVSTVVFARQLSVAEFGLATLGLIIVNYLDAINDFGIATAVIREDDEDEETISVAFWLTQITGLLAFGCAVALAPVTARLFHQPRLALIQVVLGSVFVLSSLFDVHDALLQRRMQWRRRAPADFLRTTLKGLVAIGLAFAGFGAWSLVWSQVVAALAFGLAVMFILPWRPKLVWNTSIAKRQARFGGQVMLTTVFATLLKDADFVLIGIYASTTELGAYSLGFRLPDLAIMGITWSLSASMFPVFARVKDDRAALGRAVIKLQRILSAVLVPLGTVMAVGSVHIVAVLYGPAWRPTADVMPFIAAYSVLYGFAFVGGDAFKAIDRVDVINKVALARLPITVAVLWFAAQHGIVAVAAAQLALMLANFVVQSLLVNGLLGLPVQRIFAALVPSLLGAVALAGVLLGAFALPLPALAQLCVGGGLGLIAYLVVLTFFERSLLSDLLATVRKRGGSSRQFA